MILNIRIQDLLKLLWKKIVSICLITVLFGLISIPLANAQYEYNRNHYSKPIIDSIDNSEEDTKINTITTVYISINGYSMNNKPPISEIAQVMQNNQVKSRAIQDTMVLTGFTKEKVFNKGLSITTFANLGLIQIQSTALESMILISFAECLLQETLSELSPFIYFSWEINHNDFSPKIDSNDDGNDEPAFLQLPRKPNAYVRIIGTAMLLGFVLVIVFILAIDLVRPVVKGIIDAQSNFDYPVILMQDAEKWINNHNVVLYPVGRIQNHTAYARLLKLQSNSTGELLSVICIRNYHTTYEALYKTVESIANRDSIALILI